MQLLEIDGEVVSSSHIRGLVLGGAIEYAGQLLGDPFTLAGEVVHGDERGRELGYPTANLVPDPRFVTPAHGVYAARATTSAGETVPAAVSIGVRPTFVTGPRRAHRGLPARLRRRPLRHPPGARLPQAPARREAL